MSQGNNTRNLKSLYNSCKTFTGVKNFMITSSNIDDWNQRRKDLMDAYANHYVPRADTEVSKHVALQQLVGFIDSSGIIKETSWSSKNHVLI